MWSCLKRPWSQLIHAKVVGYLLMFGPVQEVHGVIWSMEKVLDVWSYLILPKRSLRPLVHQNVLDILCLISETNPETFVMDQTHYWMFCTGSDIKDVLAWTKQDGCSGHDQVSADTNKVLFSCYTENKNFPDCFVDSLSGFKSFYFIWRHPVSAGTRAIFNASRKVFC